MLKVLSPLFQVSEKLRLTAKCVGHVFVLSIDLVVHAHDIYFILFRGLRLALSEMQSFLPCVIFRLRVQELL